MKMFIYLCYEFVMIFFAIFFMQFLCISNDFQWIPDEMFMKFL